MSTFVLAVIKSNPAIIADGIKAADTDQSINNTGQDAHIPKEHPHQVKLDKSN